MSVRARVCIEADDFLLVGGEQRADFFYFLTRLVDTTLAASFSTNELVERMIEEGRMLIILLFTFALFTFFDAELLSWA